jgi:hypothetical protein
MQLASSLGAGSNKVPYSPTEKRMFEAIPKRGRISTTDLVQAYWNGHKPPYNSRVSAMDALRSLKRKIIANREPFKVVTSDRAGAKPLDVWIETKKR